MNYIDFTVIATLSIQVFAIMDPLAAIPALAQTFSGYSEKNVRNLINRASLVIFLLLTFFSTVGGYFLAFLGIDIPSLRIAAGIVLMAVSIDTLITGHKPSSINPGEYVIVPIATPLIVGPGTMTLLITSSKVYGILNTLIASYIAFIFTYLVLSISNKILRVLGTTFIHGLGRFMSIVIAAFAVEMFIMGVKDALKQL
ncbi:MAG: MarC family protein [Ignisphaera sp.]|uniref:UPF0056 membrane protein n=1 Tax=Ignisphaera aggregans TaxID=334771 RepID=A0A7C4NTZ0_9CREN